MQNSTIQNATLKTIPQITKEQNAKHYLTKNTLQNRKYNTKTAIQNCTIQKAASENNTTDYKRTKYQTLLCKKYFAKYHNMI